MLSSPSNAVRSGNWRRSDGTTEYAIEDGESLAATASFREMHVLDALQDKNGFPEEAYRAAIEEKPRLSHARRHAVVQDDLEAPDGIISASSSTASMNPG